MKLYNYIHKSTDTECLVFTTSPEKLIISDIHIELDKGDIEKYRLHIKYINCCHFDENGLLSYDHIKVLAEKLDKLSIEVENHVMKFRRLIVEAMGMGKQEHVEKIGQTIKALNEFITDDFSRVKNIKDIDTLTCPELNIDFVKYYADKIYGI